MRQVTLKEHSQFDCKYWILSTATTTPTFTFTLAFLNEKNTILWDITTTQRHTSLTFVWVKSWTWSKE